MDTDSSCHLCDSSNGGFNILAGNHHKISKFIDNSDIVWEFFRDFERDDGGWEPAGFIRHTNVLPQRWLVQLLLFGPETQVQRVSGTIPRQSHNSEQKHGCRQQEGQ